MHKAVSKLEVCREVRQLAAVVSDKRHAKRLSHGVCFVVMVSNW